MAIGLVQTDMARQPGVLVPAIPHLVKIEITPVVIVDLGVGVVPIMVLDYTLFFIMFAGFVETFVALMKTIGLIGFQPELHPVVSM